MARTKSSNSWYSLVGEQLETNRSMGFKELVKEVGKKRPNPNEGTIRTQRGYWLADHPENGRSTRVAGIEVNGLNEELIAAIGRLSEAQFKEIKEYLALRERI